MAFQALYRRYRPQRFAELKGQDHVAAALRNAVRDGAVSHFYLFSGPRGTGKTSTARILAKALNCENLHDGEPCGVCESCRAVEAGTSMAVTELDAASNNGVEAVRDLIQRASLGTSGRTKVYIVDEVHMLSNAASNALLKTLEDPPGHVVFVLATTDPHKVLPTIRSRAQQLDFRLLPAPLLGAHLREVAADAGLDVTDVAIDRAVRRGDGSARDALSALDQIVASGGEGDDDASVDEVVEGLCDRDAGRALGGVALACGAGLDPRTVAAAVASHLRDALLSLMAPELVSLPDAVREGVADQARRLGAAALVRALDAVGDAVLALPNAPDPRVTLEVALVRVTRAELDASAPALLERIERLERLERLERAQPSAASPDGHRIEASNPGPTPADAPRRTAAAGAREALGAATERSHDASSEPPARVAAKPALGSLRRSPQAATDPDDSTPRGATSPEGSAPGVTSPADRSGSGDSSPAPSGRAGGADPPSLPTVTELSTAWSDHVLGQLHSVARGRFSTGRFVDVADGAVVLALSSDIMARKCEEKRPELEAALASHFGRPVPVRLVVDAGSSPPGAEPSGPLGAPPEGDDELHPDEIRDLAAAPADHRSGIDRLAQAFPGAEVVDGG